jgi:hypothetical protein
MLFHYALTGCWAANTALTGRIQPITVTCAKKSPPQGVQRKQSKKEPMAGTPQPALSR